MIWSISQIRIWRRNEELTWLIPRNLHSVLRDAVKTYKFFTLATVIVREENKTLLVIYIYQSKRAAWWKTVPTTKNRNKLVISNDWLGSSGQCEGTRFNHLRSIDLIKPVSELTKGFMGDQMFIIKIFICFLGELTNVCYMKIRIPGK